MNSNISDLLNQLIKYINLDKLFQELPSYFYGVIISFLSVSLGLIYKILNNLLKTNVEIHLIIPAFSIEELKGASTGNSWKTLNNDNINVLFSQTRYFFLSSKENSVNFQGYLNFSSNTEPKYKDQLTYVKISLKIPHKIEIYKENFDTFRKYEFSDIHIQECTYLNNLSGLNKPIIIRDTSQKFERVL